jgi:sortase A
MLVEMTEAGAFSKRLQLAQPPSNAQTRAGPANESGRQGVWRRRFEFLAWGMGLFLLAVWGLGRLVGTALERRDLRRFREAEAVASAAPASALALTADAHPVDQSLWAKERIRAYARALKEPSPTPLAVLRIPRIGLEVPVLVGTDEWTLDRGVGWVEGTARPGEPGNVGIAGHRDGFFRGLKDVRLGDELELPTLGGQHRYRVEEIRIVLPEDVQVLEATPVPTVTLITCYPFFFVGSAPQRYVVRASLMPATSSELAPQMDIQHRQ